MMAFNPFEGGPARKAPAVNPDRFTRFVHRPLVDGEMKDDPFACMTFKERIMWHVDCNPTQTRFETSELTDCIPDCPKPTIYLHQLVRERQLDYHHTSTTKTAASYCRAGEGIEAHEMKSRTTQFVLAALSRIGVAVSAPGLLRFADGALTESQVSNSLATLCAQGKVYRRRRCRGGFLWSVK